MLMTQSSLPYWNLTGPLWTFLLDVLGENLLPFPQPQFCPGLAEFSDTLDGLLQF